MARKPRKEHHEEHADETWLVPYSDILTLLLALFIVLFASSQVDQQKLEQMSSSLSIAFSGSPSFFDKQNAVESMRPTVPQPQMPNINMPDFNVVPAASGVEEKAYLKETAELLEVKRKMDAYIEAHGLEMYLSTHLTDEGLMIRIKETALFPSGSADLNMNSRHLAAQIAEMLIPLTQQVTISGHTDNVPITTREFPSNWELSSRRAVNFTKLVLSQGSSNRDTPLAPERFRSIGYSEYHPVDTNETAEGRATNRRVEVFIMRNYRI